MRAMTRAELEALREDLDFEAKAAQGRDRGGELPRSFWETYSAFANTDGGRILLGATERPDGSLEPLGVRSPRKVRKELWDSLGNRQVVSANLLLERDVEEVECEGRVMLLVAVPRAGRAQRPVYLGSNPLSGAFRRGFEGDYRCPEAEARRMLADAVDDTRDARLLPGFGVGDLDAGSLAAYRNVFRSTKPGHVWLGLDDVELLRSLGGWGRDRQSGEEGLTLAGLLMFGRQPTILEAVPYYLVDYREEPLDDPEQRWVDRVTTDGTWSGNLFDFFRRAYERLTRDLKVPFRLEEGHHRRDETLVHEALREALVNTLIHADYSGSVGILVVRRPDGFSFRNPGDLRVPPRQALAGGSTDCRNRSLQKMFQQIGEGEQAGSGLPKILRAWREQSWREPMLREEVELGCTTLWLPMLSLLPQEALDQLAGIVGPGFAHLDEADRLALVTALVEGRVSNQRLQEITAEHPRDLTFRLADLVGHGYLHPAGKGRGTTYRLVRGESLARVAGSGVVSGPSSEQPAPSSLHSVPSSEHLAPSSLHSGRISLHSAPSSLHSGPSPAHSGPSSAHLPGGARDGEAGELAALEARGAAVRDRTRVPVAVMESTLLDLCQGRFLGLRMLATLVGRSPATLQIHYLSRLVRAGRLELRYPDRPSHPAQEYRTREEAP